MFGPRKIWQPCSEVLSMFLQIKNGFGDASLFMPWLRGTSRPSQEQEIAGSNQGCQMVCFQTKNPNLG
jgi:hypothetical protein